jgi:hypothetical protein
MSELCGRTLAADDPEGKKPLVSCAKEFMQVWWGFQVE